MENPTSANDHTPDDAAHGTSAHGTSAPGEAMQDTDSQDGDPQHLGDQYTNDQDASELEKDDRDYDTGQRGVISWLRERLKMLSDEYAEGNLNAAQFNALYRHYSEKRILVEKLIQRDPDSTAWQTAAQPGFTSNLRDRFESRPRYYVVFKRGTPQPLIAAGKLPEEVARQVLKFARAIWRLPSWKQGLARKSLGDGYWMLLVTGANTFTMAIYFMEPSANQGNELRDMHADFERANEGPLTRNMPPERFVFPQRALLEQ
ncbi:hypothetical protein G4Y79_08160 [Phototrophicus methaneseepsis]|uniref:Uncharacterized protein n=1 Tax=Phototrophicus methaneseepsis TaxID=2710758 RepID=A0A7S8ECA7_9CHLR|nr:hypothetical protein [Phototrophicus methaneseepsis]QPC84335.1 hypothetical protein G4Y79_08160 [Phototrophicus methaneseepsis]